MAEELIVFVDESGRPTGKTGPKLASHHAKTKLHLAFSCYIFDESGKLLVTQRAHSKKVWPGVWTNSVCGHPGPGESLEQAVKRRAAYELGMTIAKVKKVVSDYRYTTPPFNGIVENEFCPIFTAQAKSSPKPNPDEVASYKWLNWKAYDKELKTHPGRYSYWAKDQFKYLDKLLAS